MTTSSEHIRLLFMEQLTGTLSESDSEELSDLLATDAEARALWAVLAEEADVLNAADFAGGLDPQAELALLHAAQSGVDHVIVMEPAVLPERTATAHLPAQAGVIIPLYRCRLFRAAVVLLVLAAGGLYFILRPSAVKAPLAGNHYVPAKKQAVQLLIAGQEAVALTGDSAIQQLQSGDVQLQNGTNGLAYTGNGSNAMNTLQVPPAQDYRLTLSDGTAVWLNATTRLRFPFNFSGNKREVYLEGEGYFKVAKNSTQPFIVHTAHTTVQVLGTAFNINTYDTKETTSLVEGAVMVIGPDSNKIQLKPGREAVYSGVDKLRVQDFEEGDALSWMKGISYFHNTTLQDMQPLLQRWFDVKVVFDHPMVGNTMVTGMVEKNKLPEFLQDLQTTTHIRYYFSGNQLHFDLP
ncbi:FecR family protein [Chitinophaga sp.]|uniref:FecR family protein n=1 Tax=Chitinophaga sp. TaxID=1869181 RepID=UPI002F94E712